MMAAKTMNQLIVGLTIISMLSFVSTSSVTPETGLPAPGNLAAFDSDALKMISDEDQQNMIHIKQQIARDYADFKSINEIHAFLDKVKLLVQKHPKNVAFAQGDLKELLKFLSQETVTRLIRVDTEPFLMPINEDKFAIAQRAVDEDELTRKLFGGPLRSLIETRRQQVSRTEDGNHKDGNFFTNIWCKIAGTCSNQ